MLHRIAALTAATALLLAGCGSTSSSKPTLVARADAICKGLNTRRAAANAQVGAVTGAAALPKIARVAPGLLAYEHTVVAELRQLSAPPSMAGAWRTILASTQQLVDNTAKLDTYARAGDLKAVEGVIHEDQQNQRKIIPIAATAGFAHCGRNA